MRRTLFTFISISILIGQLFLATGLKAFSAVGDQKSAGESAGALLLPPTARPSLTPSLTPAATDTPAPQPTQPPRPNPTNTPLPATNTPAPPTAIIAQNVINVRSGPGVVYDIIGVAHQNERYLVTGQFPPGDWLQIDYSGKTGWLFRSLVTLEGAVDQIPPITDIPPTPTSIPSPTPTDTPAPTDTPTALPTQAGDTPAPPTEPPPTDTPPPATATPGPPMAVIIGPNASIRQGPGQVYDTIGEASQGESYPITGIFVTGDWFQIDDKGQTGWIFLDQIAPVTDASRLPVIKNIPPTPTVTPMSPLPSPTPEAAVTPPSPATPATGSGGPPTGLLIIGGLITLALAGGILVYSMHNKSA